MIDTPDLLDSLSRGIGHHLLLRWETQDSSPVATGTPVEFLWSFNREVGPSFCVEAWTSTFLLIFERGISRSWVELRQGSWAFSRGATGESEIISCVVREYSKASNQLVLGNQFLIFEVNGTLCRFDLCRKPGFLSKFQYRDRPQRCEEKAGIPLRA